MFVKALGLGVFRIYQQRKRRHLLTCPQAPVHSAADQHFAKPCATPVRAACQTPQAKTRHGVPGELFPVAVTELRHIDLCSAEAVVTQDFTGPLRIQQNINRGHAFTHVLQGQSVQVVIQLGNATAKSGTVMKRCIQRVLFKHV